QQQQPIAKRDSQAKDQMAFGRKGGVRNNKEHPHHCPLERRSADGLHQNLSPQTTRLLTDRHDVLANPTDHPPKAPRQRKIGELLQQARPGQARPGQAMLSKPSASMLFSTPTRSAR
ncbi:unnamed protein product, partial [Ectocarpus sp. 8 AP-2014]